jgi:hypothetical protein
MQRVPKQRSTFWEVIRNKELYKHTRPRRNVLGSRAIALYIPKTVDKEEMPVIVVDESFDS